KISLERRGWWIVDGVKHQPRATGHQSRSLSRKVECPANNKKPPQGGFLFGVPTGIVRCSGGNPDQRIPRHTPARDRQTLRRSGVQQDVPRTSCCRTPRGSHRPLASQTNKPPRGGLDLFGVPTGIRTPVTAVKGRCPRPLDDGDCVLPSGCCWLVEVSGIEPLTSCMPCKRSPS